jgi:hypothetical protein
VYTECKELKLPNIDSDHLVRDFVYIVELIILSWSEYWKNEFKRLKWKNKKLLSFFKLIKIY